MKADFRDLTIEMFADDETALIERLVDMTLERDSYRVLAQQAIQYAAAVVRERDQLHKRYRELFDAHRAKRRANLASRSAA